MAQSLLKLVFLAGVILLGATAVFIGSVVTARAVSTGSITYSYRDAGSEVVKTFNRSEDARGFWRTVGQFGLLPIAVGGLSVWWGRRRLRAKA